MTDIGTHWFGCWQAHFTCAEKRIEDLEALAKTMALELAKWGWGDMHYGPQPQERSVVAVLEEYRRVLQTDGRIGDASDS